MTKMTGSRTRTTIGCARDPTASGSERIGTEQMNARIRLTGMVVLCLATTGCYCGPSPMYGLDPMCGPGPVCPPTPCGPPPCANGPFCGGLPLPLPVPIPLPLPIPVPSGAHVAAFLNTPICGVAGCSNPYFRTPHAGFVQPTASWSPTQPWQGGWVESVAPDAAGHPDHGGNLQVPPSHDAYIPPTGVPPVPDTSSDLQASNNDISASAANGVQPTNWEYSASATNPRVVLPGQRVSSRELRTGTPAEAALLPIPAP